MMNEGHLGKASVAEIQGVVRFEEEVFDNLTNRLLRELRGAAQRRTLNVSQLEHALQTATRAMNAGADDRYVVAALLHDIGDSLAPTNHGDIAAAILRPFVDDRTWWVVKHHPVFQAQYYYPLLGQVWAPPAAILEHEFAADTQEFCERYDEPAFSETFTAKSLEYFEPVLRRVLAHPINVPPGM
ncbi:HD domain-containing protein [Nocardioides humi]|nr:HD domain-containing protein [Nocardioides humi]